MKLTVDRLDLLPEHEDTNCSQVRLVHFKPDVQIAIIAAGGATFREFDGSSYNRVLLNDSEPDEVVDAASRSPAEPDQFSKETLRQIEALRAKWGHGDVLWRCVERTYQQVIPQLYPTNAQK